MLAAVAWGTLPTWLLFALAVFVAWRLSKGGAGAAVTELTAANSTLERSLNDARDKLGAELRDLKIENAELRGRTDIAIALLPVVDWTKMHEQRAQERHAATIIVLDLIAARLGPDPNGASANG